MDLANFVAAYEYKNRRRRTKNDPHLGDKFANPIEDVTVVLPIGSFHTTAEAI
jgi:hypothetical protein